MNTLWAKACVRLLLSVGCASSLLATNYYVDSSGGTASSDSYNGLSPTFTSGSNGPWQHLNKVSAVATLNPGDTINLKRGSVWTATSSSTLMTLNGSGTSAAPIVVQDYGTGALPVLDLDQSVVTNAVGIAWTNRDWITLQNLEIRNSDNVSQGDRPIKDTYSTLGHQGLKFYNLTYTSASFALSAPVTLSPTDLSALEAPGSTQYILANIEIAGLTLTHVPTAVNCLGGISVSPRLTTDTDYTTLPANSAQNVLIRNTTENTSGRTAWGIAAASNVTLISCNAVAPANTYMPLGTTGAFFYRTAGLTVINSSITSVPNTGSTDQTGVDPEAYQDGTTFRGCFFGNNSGSGIEFLQLNVAGRTADYNIASEVSSCTFKLNGTAGVTSPTNYTGSLMHARQSGASTPIEFGGTAQDNLYYEGAYGFMTDTVQDGSGSTFASSWTIADNFAANSAATLFNACDQFSSTQGQNGWHYTLNGTDLSTYSSTTGEWSGSTGYVSKFNLLPTATATDWIGREWIATAAGTVQIRGWVVKNDVGGDGVSVRITRTTSGGTTTTVWGPRLLAAGDRTGFATNLDNFTLAAADKLRFEVSLGGTTNTGDLTSWIPSIAYTATQTISSPAAQWMFDNTATDATGRGHDLTLHGTPAYTTAAIAGPAALSLNGTSQYASAGNVLDPLLGSYSVSVWFKRSSAGVPPSTTQYIATKGNGNSISLGWSIFMSSVDGALCVRLNADNSTVQRIAQDHATPISDTNWHHVVLVFDRTAGTIKGYLDGSNSGWTAGGGGATTDTYPGLNSIATTALLDLGTVDAGTTFFGGVIDQVRIYQRALSATEVGLLYANP